MKQLTNIQFGNGWLKHSHGSTNFPSTEPHAFKRKINYKNHVSVYMVEQ